MYLVLYWIIAFVEQVYKTKGHYEPHFWPPDNYIRG